MSEINNIENEKKSMVLDPVSLFRHEKIVGNDEISTEKNLNKTQTDVLINNENRLSFLFTSEKAGMEGLNREEINRIILDATKHSIITKNKEDEYDKIKKIVDDYKIKIDNLHKNSILYEQNKKIAENKLKEYERDRDLSHIWMHLDMDMFFAAVELLDKPHLKDLPVAVGDDRMVSTSNYVARKFGVRSAMPGFLAKKLCPQLIFISPNYLKYKEESRKIMDILLDYDSEIESMGLDEAYLDITKYCNDNYITSESELISLVTEIKFKIFQETKLTCSIGISCNKMLAKICSDKNKPDGLFILLSKHKEEIIRFMKDINVRKIPFVGEKTEQKLNLLGWKTCNDISENMVDIFYILHENQFEFLINASLGIGETEHEKNVSKINKSISCSETFKMTNDKIFIKTTFDRLAKKLYQSMLEDKVTGKNLGLEIKDKNDKVVSRTIALKKNYETENEIKNHGWNCLCQIIENTSIRLIRLKLSSLVSINPDEIKRKPDDPILKWIKKIPKNTVNGKKIIQTDLEPNNDLNDNNKQNKYAPSLKNLNINGRRLYSKNNEQIFQSKTKKSQSKISSKSQSKNKDLFVMISEECKKNISNITNLNNLDSNQLNNQRNTKTFKQKASENSRTGSIRKNTPKKLKRKNKNHNNTSDKFYDINDLIENMKNDKANKNLTTQLEQK